MNSGARSWGMENTMGQTGSLLEGVRAALGGLAGGREQTNTGLQRASSGTRCLQLVGVLDRHMARKIKQQAHALMNAPEAAAGAGWGIDLSEVSRWDSEGLAALVHVLDVSDRNGQPLTLFDPNPALRHTLEQAQLHHLFTIVQREEV